MLAQAEADLALVGADALRLTIGELQAEHGIPANRSRRLKTLANQRAGMPGKTPAHTASLPPPKAPRVDALPPISRWDDAPRQGLPASLDFLRTPVPEDEERPIEELLAEQEARYLQAKRRAVTLGVRQLQMPPGPYAVAHFGDPHLDDDGCDWPALRKAVAVVAKTKGMYAGNVGDVANNWVGRLTALHGEQHATVDDAWRLARWLLDSVPWLYLVLGNHDQWNSGAQLYKRMVESCRIGLMAPDEVRLELVSPGSERPLRLHVRHDFSGKSIWSRVHGPLRASKLDGWGDVYVAGHRHEWATHMEEGADGRVRWMMRARGFKRFDAYARSLGFTEQQHGEVVTTLVDPAHKHPAERVRVFLDIEEAAEALTWLRQRRGAS